MALALPDNPHVHFFESRRSGYVCNRSRTRPRVSANARGLRCAGSEGRYFDVEDICGRKWQARRDDGLALSSQNGQVGTVTHWVDRLDTHWRPDEWTRGGSSTFRACLDHQYSALHCNVARAVQGHLALISTPSLPRPAASPSSLARSGSEWSQIDLDVAMLQVHRLKSGKPATHPIRGDEMRALRKVSTPGAVSRPLIFVSHELAPTRFKDFWRKPFTAVRKRCQISGTRRVGLSQGSRLTQGRSVARRILAGCQTPSEAADEFSVGAESGKGVRRGILDVAVRQLARIVRHFRGRLEHDRCGGNHSSPREQRALRRSYR